MPTTIRANWAPLNPAAAAQLVDARLQLHHAAQFATAIGISYLTRRPDDSHTNLGWDPRHEALASREVRALSHAVRVAIRPRDLTLIVLIDGSIGQQIPLHGSTMNQVEAGLRSALAAAGLDGRRLTMKRHYDLPAHPVTRGDAFDTTRDGEFEELAHWFGNAAIVLTALQKKLGSSEVRCWPHHFDIATLITLGPSRTSGVGMLPGDAQFPEPYYYVNTNPAPPAEHVRTLPAPPGGGFWNTEGWFGAVLIASRLDPDPSRQQQQVEEFMSVARSEG